MHYFYVGDIDVAANGVLHGIETRLSWRQNELPLLPRIAKIIDALLTMKEVCCGLTSVVPTAFTALLMSLTQFGQQLWTFSTLVVFPFTPRAPEGISP